MGKTLKIDLFEFEPYCFLEGGTGLNDCEEKASRIIEPSFVTKPFPEKPDYLVNKEWYNAEGHEKWHTEDNDNYFYDSVLEEE